MDFNYCMRRKIENVNVMTPILVPSFSSKGIKHFKMMYNFLVNRLTEASLVSAYDLYYKFIDAEKIYETEIVFIDSGGYEAIAEHDCSDIYGNEYSPNEWKLDFYLEQVNKIEPLTNIVLVNYDSQGMSTLEQIEKAKDIFSMFPHYTSDFLYKPIKDNGLLNINEYLEHIELVSPFSILGFTEKELGQSVLERCRNIYRIREALEGAGLDKPIHIFGCLDPLNIIVYFLCGADIFDGLSWLRFSFYNNNPTYFNSYSISRGFWHLSDVEVKLLSCSENLITLNELKKKMNHFTKIKDLTLFNLDKKTNNEILKLVEKVYKGE
ncbi:queuine tRNA-ribosyltransferase family protein [Anoxybacillus flavithermus]|nr:hypothetical protein [Anoxybacillus kestanbolensis]